MSQAYPARDAEILREMQAKGFRPMLVYAIGIGASAWSDSLRAVMPSAEYRAFGIEPSGSWKETSEARSPRSKRDGPVGIDGSADSLASSPHRPTPPPDVLFLDCPGQELEALHAVLPLHANTQVLLVRVRFSSLGGSPQTSFDALRSNLAKRHFRLAELSQPAYMADLEIESMRAVFVSENLPSRMNFRAIPDARVAANPTAGKVRELAQRLSALASDPDRVKIAADRAKSQNSTHGVVTDGDVIITHFEITPRHGVGALVGRMFGHQPNIISLRSRDYYQGQQDFGRWSALLSHRDKSRDAVFSRVLETFGDSTAKRALCAPFLPDDARTAIAVKELFAIPLCTFIMDDQNVYSQAIHDALLGELLAKSALRLAISPEIRAAYQRKFGLPMWFMPPLAPSQLIPTEIQIPSEPLDSCGVMIGNIWSPRWLDRLRRAVKDSGAALSWYSYGDFRHLKIGEDALAADSILVHDPPNDEDLVRILRRSWFAVVPTGTLDEQDDRWSLSQFSLPSRMIYLMATSHIPIIVVGSPKSAAARFVQQFGIGVVASYQPKSFQNALRGITDRDRNLEMRRRAHAVAGRFSDAGAADWLWRSLERGEPVDRRFEDLMPDTPLDLRHTLSGLPPVTQSGVQPEAVAAGSR